MLSAVTDIQRETDYAFSPLISGCNSSYEFGLCFFRLRTESTDFLSLSSLKTQRRREASFRRISHLKRKHSWANGFQNLLGKNYKSRSAENPDLGTGTPVLLFELQSADTVAIGFTR